MRDRLSRPGLLAVTALAGLGLLAAVALARPGPVRLKAQHVATLRATALATPKGRTLYRLKPETTRHLLCTSPICLAVWPPFTVPSKSRKIKLPRGLRGSVGFLRRGRTFQVTLNEHPLYRFAPDTRAGQAKGQRITSFGGTWFAIVVKRDRSAVPPSHPPSPYPY
jgi:predicted lipoprotein with Yx(FWY)xxD motif